MKILHVIPALRKGGAERILIDICNELKRREDINVRILAFEEGNDYAFLCDQLDISYCKVRIQLSLTRKSIVELDEYEGFVEEFKPDIIHSHSFYTDLITHQNIQPSIAYFSHFHLYYKEFNNFSLETFFYKKRLTDFLDKHFLVRKYKKYSNCYFINISSATLDFYKSRLPECLYPKFYFLPNGVNFTRFQTKPKHSDNNSVRLVTVGRLDANKNHTFLLEAVSTLVLKNYCVQLFILGEGPQRMVLEKRIKSLNLKDNVFLEGNVDKVEDYFTENAIYVQSSLSETFSISTLEAMAAGLPCVVINSQGNKDLVINDFNGYIIGWENRGKFSEFVELIIKNKEMYQKFSTNAKKAAQESCIENYTEKLLLYYRKSIKEVKHT